MKITLTIYLIFFAILASYSQSDLANPIFAFGPTNISFGTVQGIHPNLRNKGFGSFLNGEIQQGLTIKGIPIKIVGHLSNESLRIGRPSYFRISYDNVKFAKMDFSKTQQTILNKSKELESKQQELYAIESKLSYQKHLLNELHKIGLLSAAQTIDSQELDLNLDSISFPSIPSKIDLAYDSLKLNGTTELENKLPLLEQTRFQNSKLDSINQQIESLSTSLVEVTNSIETINQELNDLKKANLSSFIPKGLKVNRANLGLTSLSSGGLSNNTLPIHGLHVEGTYRRIFYDVSAGLTQPFQNFSLQVFNQITANNQNVFNLNELFQMNKMKLVTSEIIGFGDKETKHIKVEHFYSGRSWEAIKKSQSEPISNTFNLSGKTTLLRAQNLNLGFLVGTSISGKDTIEKSYDFGNVAYRGILDYHLKNKKTELQAEMRSLGANYDGASQGLMINGTRHFMLGYIQKVGTFTRVAIRYMEDHFSKTDSVVLFTNSKRLMAQVTSRLNYQNKFQLNYSIIQGSGEETNSRKGHLGTFTFFNEVKMGKNYLNSVFQAGYTLVPNRIDNQEVRQMSLSTDYYTKAFSFGLKGSYEYYSGLQNLFGENYILEPHIGFKASNGEFFVAYQYLESEQFGSDNGISLRAIYRPSRYFTWQITGQRWLAKERSFFYYQVPDDVIPWYIDLKFTLHLNVKK